MRYQEDHSVSSIRGTAEFTRDELLKGMERSLLDKLTTKLADDIWANHREELVGMVDLKAIAKYSEDLLKNRLGQALGLPEVEYDSQDKER